MTNIEEIEETIKSYDYVNFQSIEKEEWSIYSLKDGTIIKLKAIPLKFLKQNNDIKINPLFVMVPFAPRNLRGEPTAKLPPTPEEMMQQIEDADMKFDVIQEPWNGYELEGDTQYFIKTTAVIISRTRLHDSGGEPIYLISHQMITKKHPLF